MTSRRRPDLNGRREPVAGDVGERVAGDRRGRDRHRHRHPERGLWRPSGRVHLAGRTDRLRKVRDEDREQEARADPGPEASPMPRTSCSGIPSRVAPRASASRRPRGRLRRRHSRAAGGPCAGRLSSSLRLAKKYVRAPSASPTPPRRRRRPCALLGTLEGDGAYQSAGAECEDDADLAVGPSAGEPEYAPMTSTTPRRSPTGRGGHRLPFHRGRLPARSYAETMAPRSSASSCFPPRRSGSRRRPAEAISRAISPPTSAEVRLRRIGGGRAHGQGRHGLSRDEREIRPRRRQFEALWQLTEGKRISKRRHRRESGEGTIESTFTAVPTRAGRRRDRVRLGGRERALRPPDGSAPRSRR